MSYSQREIVQRLTELKNEHRELDEIIEVLIRSGEIDELKIKRLKKRKPGRGSIYEDMEKIRTRECQNSR